jgi:predicted transcriptional regulator
MTEASEKPRDARRGKQRVTLWLQPELVARYERLVETLATTTEQTRSSVMRIALREWIEQRERRRRR